MIDTDYILALATADDFLHASMHRNVEEGMKYISGDLIKSRGEEDIKLAISGMSNPHHLSFEILGAKKINSDTFRFNTWDYEYYSNDQAVFEVSERLKCSYVDVTKYKSDSNESKWLVSGFGLE